MPSPNRYPSTPDGRYFVVAGHLWRTSNPGLAPDERQQLVDRLMQARRQVAAALKAHDAQAQRNARAAVDELKRALGERGPVWWSDGAPDFNRRMVTNTPYAQWYAGMQADADTTLSDPTAGDMQVAAPTKPGVKRPSPKT